MQSSHGLELQSKIRSHDCTELFVRFICEPSAANKIPIILNDGLGCDGFAWKHFIDYFKDQHPIIHWHYRGHGYSDTPKNIRSLSIKNLGKDIISILDDFKIDQAILAGHSMGVQVSLEAYKQNKNRFAGLLLLCGSFEHPLETWHAAFERDGGPRPLNIAMKLGFSKVFNQIKKRPDFWQPLWSILFNTQIPYKIAMLLEVNRNRVKKEELAPYFEHLSTMKAITFMQMLKSYSEHSARQVLKKINIPTLIICGGRDTFSPYWVSMDMHHLIKNSELLYISDGTHLTPIEHPELVNLRVEKFLWSNFQSKASIQTETSKAISC